MAQTDTERAMLVLIKRGIAAAQRRDAMHILPLFILGEYMAEVAKPGYTQAEFTKSMTRIHDEVMAFCGYGDTPPKDASPIPGVPPVFAAAFGVD